MVEKFVDAAREILLFRAIAGILMEQFHKLTDNLPSKNVNGHEDHAEWDSSSELDQFIKGCGPIVNGYMNSLNKALEQSFKELEEAQADRRKRDAAIAKRK